MSALSTGADPLRMFALSNSTNDHGRRVD